MIKRKTKKFLYILSALVSVVFGYTIGKDHADYTNFTAGDVFFKEAQADVPPPPSCGGDTYSCGGGDDDGGCGGCGCGCGGGDDHGGCACSCGAPDCGQCGSPGDELY